MAREIGAKYYIPAKGAPPGSWMANNQVWIREQMASGRQIFDIGPEQGRRMFLGETSPYYAMEHNEIFGSGYRNYAMIWTDESFAAGAAAA
jgi:hypothetical protein